MSTGVAASTETLLDERIAELSEESSAATPFQTRDFLTVVTLTIVLPAVALAWTWLSWV